MVKRILIFFFLAITMYVPVQAQSDTTGDPTTPLLKHRHLRISLLTCSPGNESYETFGHIGLRVIDSTKTGISRDLVYNYGAVDFFDGRISYKFLSGTLTTYLEAAQFPLFVKLYADEGRGVTEQVLLLNDLQKEAILTYLENNALIENRYSDFDIVYDNCTTQTRDAILKALGDNLILGQVISKDPPHTFRDGCDEYLKHKYWLKVVMNIFFARRIDKITSNTEAMQIPSYLSEGIGNATINGQKLCVGKTIICEDKLQKYSQINDAFLFILIVSLLTIAGLTVHRFNILGKIMSTFVLLVTGLLGCCILCAWFSPRHPEFRDNFNLLWALPTNVIIPFLNQKIKAKYAPVAMCLLGIFLIIDLMKIQVMPLFEIGSLLLALLYIYYIMLRNGKTKSHLPDSINSQ